MTLAQAQPSDESEPLCPDCGYSLTGLAPGHACPECGVTQPPEVIVIWGDGEPDTTGSSSWRILAIPAVLMVVAASVAVGIWFGRFVAYAFFIAVFAAVAWLLSRRPDARVAGPMQLRLGPQGFATRRGFGPVRWRRWKPRWEVRISSMDTGRVGLSVVRPLIGSLALDRGLRFTTRMSLETVAGIAKRIQG